MKERQESWQFDCKWFCANDPISNDSVESVHPLQIKNWYFFQIQTHNMHIQMQCKQASKEKNKSGLEYNLPRH